MGEFDYKEENLRSYHACPHDPLLTHLLISCFDGSVLLPDFLLEALGRLSPLPVDRWPLVVSEDPRGRLCGKIT